MKKFVVAALLVCGGLMVGSTASAQAVKLKKAWASAKESATEGQAEIKKACGVDITVGFNEASFKNLEEIEGPARWCGGSVASGVAYMCADADYKAELVKRVKKVTCTYDSALKTESKDNYGNKLELKGTELIHTYNKDSANVSEKVQDFLKNAL